MLARGPTRTATLNLGPLKIVVTEVRMLYAGPTHEQMERRVGADAERLQWDKTGGRT